MGEMFTSVETDQQIIEIDALKGRIRDLEADKNSLYEWGRKLETENKRLREQLASELVYGTDRSTADGAPPYCGASQPPLIENADRWAKQIADGFPGTPVDTGGDAK